MDEQHLAIGHIEETDATPHDAEPAIRLADAIVHATDGDIEVACLNALNDVPSWWRLAAQVADVEPDEVHLWMRLTRTILRDRRAHTDPFGGFPR